MNKTEYANLVKLYATKWPSVTITPEITKSWAEDLLDLQAEHVYAAIQALSAELAFPPGPGVIRNRALDLIEPRPMSAAKAWQEVKANLTRCGTWYTTGIGDASGRTNAGGRVEMPESDVTITGRDGVPLDGVLVGGAEKYVPEMTPEFIEFLKERYFPYAIWGRNFEVSEDELKRAALQYTQRKYDVTAGVDRRKWSDPLIGEIADDIGWKELAEADDFHLKELRREFVKAWDAAQARRKSQRRMPPATQALLAKSMPRSPTFKELLLDAARSTAKELEATNTPPTPAFELLVEDLVGPTHKELEP